MRIRVLRYNTSGVQPIEDAKMCEKDPLGKAPPNRTLVHDETLRANVPIWHRIETAVS
jgi:hypothetical protein